MIRSDPPPLHRVYATRPERNEIPNKPKGLEEKPSPVVEASESIQKPTIDLWV